MVCTFKAAALLMAAVLLVGARPLSAPGGPAREPAGPSAEPPASAPPGAPAARLFQRPARYLEDAVGRAKVHAEGESISLYLVGHCGDDPDPRIVIFVKPYVRKTVSRKCKKTGLYKQHDYLLQLK
ncbi:MAG TPA: hypothetical protein VF621_20055 [Pyrinomonadaceae bacterium]